MTTEEIKILNNYYEDHNQRAWLNLEESYSAGELLRMGALIDDMHHIGLKMEECLP